nr:hypothetical protein B0A51_13512 [Rachicladosporium sp. CCFEE 5018]
MNRSQKLAPEVNRALFVKNLSFAVTPDELFDLFGKFGPIRQIRQGIANNTKGTAFVVFEDVMDAKAACDKLNGFNFQSRYLVVLYHQPEKMAKAASHAQDLAEREEKLENGENDAPTIEGHLDGVEEAAVVPAASMIKNAAKEGHTIQGAEGHAIKASWRRLILGKVQALAKRR